MSSSPDIEANARAAPARPEVETSPAPGTPRRGRDRRLVADRNEIERFVDPLFRHAPAGTYVSLRSFFHDESLPPAEIRDVEFKGELKALAKAAAAVATRAANFNPPAVFAPPICSFKTSQSAAGENLAAGLVLSVECDARPGQARNLLEGLLGPVTVEAASGGEWVDPETGEVEDKLHLHWRLARPTAEPIEHAKLKRARRIAALLAESDNTAVPVVHPLRWPGSWHRKGEPRLARIVEVRTEREIDLAGALEVLEDAAHIRGVPLDDDPRPGRQAGPVDDADLAAYVVIIPNTDETDWHTWNTVGMAFYAATGGSEAGRAAFGEWSAKSEKDDGGWGERWDHYHRSPPTKLTSGKLNYLARQADPKFRLPSWSDQFDDVREYGVFGGDVRSDGAAIEEQTPADRESRFSLIQIDQIKLHTTSSYLVHGLIPREGVIGVWAPPKHLKSYWTADMLMHVALGRDYRGRKVQGGPVVYCIFESPTMFGNRLCGLRAQYSSAHDPAPPFYMQPTLLKLTSKKDREDLCAAIRSTLGTENPAVIALDTLNKSIEGSESSDADMTAYVQAAEELRETFKCAVIIIHHCGYDASHMRGHTSLAGTLAAEIKVTRGPNKALYIEAEVKEMRDGPEGAVIASELRPVTLGMDDDGNPIETLTVHPCERRGEATSTSGPKLTENQKAMWNVLLDAGPGGLTKEEWNSAAKEEGFGGHRSSQYNARKALQKHGLVREDGDRWYARGVRSEPPPDHAIPEADQLADLEN